LLFAVAVAVAVALAPRTVDTPAPGLALLMLGAALLQLAFLYHAASLRAFGRVPAVSGAQAAQAAAGAGLGLALVWSWGLWGLVAGWIAGTLLALAMMRRAGPDVPLAPAALAAGLRVARAGAPVFAFYLASLALRSVDRLALVRHAPASELGLYGLGVMAAGTLLHLPESAAFVLFPRMAAAHRGADDADLTRASVVRVQRFVTVLMPAVVGIAVLWIAPVVAWLLPAYAGGATAIATLCLAALVLSTATVPSYYLLASGGVGRLVALGAAAVLLQTVLVFAAAAAAPKAFAVARASLAGYAAFAVPVLVVAARRLAPRRATRLVLASVAPALWATALAMAAIHVMPGAGFVRGALGTLAFAAGYAPVVWLARPRATKP
jgi:O-antigen/teichoic acid export membrane protein